MAKIILYLAMILFVPSICYPLEIDKIPTDCGNMPSKDEFLLCTLAMTFQITPAETAFFALVSTAEVVADNCSFNKTHHFYNAKEKLMTNSKRKSIYAHMKGLVNIPGNIQLWCYDMYSKYGPNSASTTPFFK